MIVNLVTRLHELLEPIFLVNHFVYYPEYLLHLLVLVEFDLTRLLKLGFVLGTVSVGSELQRLHHHVEHCHAILRSRLDTLNLGYDLSIHEGVLEDWELQD